MKFSVTRFVAILSLYVLIASSSVSMLQAQTIFINGPRWPIRLPGPLQIATGDFNKDGNMDMVVGSNLNTLTASLDVFLGDGHGGFALAPGSPIITPNASAVAIGDFKENGNLDLAVLTGPECSNGYVTLYYGDGTGSFSKSLAPPTPVEALWADGIAAADFNRDGHTDLAVTSGYGLTCGSDSSRVNILLGDGQGGFRQASGSPISLSSGTYGVSVGDFNNDHIPDLAIAAHDGLIDVLRGNGDGSFSQAPSSPIFVGGDPITVAVGDYDHNGDLDLAVDNTVNGFEVSVLLGDGTGRFTNAPSSPINAGPTMNAPIATGDFNGDGNLDLATIAYNNAIVALLGNGQGGFTIAPGSPFDVATDPRWVTANDFDNDGRADLAVANYQTGNVSVLVTAKTPMKRYHQCDNDSDVPEYYDNNTISTCDEGCALTSVANLMNAVNSSSSPKTLDDFLSSAPYGYTDGGYLGWTTVLNWPLLPYKYDLVDSRNEIPQQDVLDFLQKHLGDQVVLQLCETTDGSTCNWAHYVAAVQPNGDDDWLLLDPGWTNAPFSLRAHEMGFTVKPKGVTKTFRFKVLGALAYQTVANPSSFQTVAQSPVELLVTDPSGRRLGNISSGNDIFEIPRGSYFRDFPIGDDQGSGATIGDPTGVKTAYVPGPQNGTYTVQVTGTGLGKYTLDFHAVATDGSTQDLTVSGVTNGGQTTSYQVDYSSSPGTVFTATHEVTFQTTLDDINDCFRLGLITNEGIAQALSSQISEAAAATSLNNPSAEDILNGFIRLVNAQSSIQINGVARKILLGDANSLLNQLR